MERNTAIRIESPGGMEFRDYLERSLRDPFTLDLSGLSLMEVINVRRGKNVHDLRRCSGHSDLRIFDNYVRDDFT